MQKIKMVSPSAYSKYSADRTLQTDSSAIYTTPLCKQSGPLDGTAIQRC